MKRIAFYITATLSLTACHKSATWMQLMFSNQSDFSVQFNYPYHNNSYGAYNYKTDLESIDSNDTTLWTWANAYKMQFVALPPHSSRKILLGYDDFEDIVPHDTLRIFVFFIDDVNALSTVQLHQRTIVQYMTDSYYVRYDLTLKDIEHLSKNNKDMIISVSYPPDSTMKDVKMWPPYETFAK